MIIDIIDTYDFNEDAVGLGNFIKQTTDPLSGSDRIVYVQDSKGRFANSAQFVRMKLSDGSTIVNLFIDFE